MGLFIGIVVLAIVWVTHYPATAGIKKGQENYWDFDREIKEFARRDAQEKDRYFDPHAGMINKDFYSDGSVFSDPAAGRYYEKGKYYCQSNGMTAQYRIANESIMRPTNKTRRKDN